MPSRTHPYIKSPRLRQAAPHLQQSDLTPIILDSPHSGISFPPYARTERNQILKKDKDFFRRYADLFVDELIAKTINAGASTVSAPYARSFTDLNRTATDIFPSQRSEENQTIENNWNEELRLSLFWRSIGNIQLWDYLPPAEINRRLRWIWKAYHDLIQSQMLAAHEKFGVAILLNCHSMASTVSGLQGCHVILGDQNGTSCNPALTDFAFNFFTSQGLKTAINQPFSGGAIIQNQSNPSANHHALQIEIRRDLYMNETQFRRGDNFSVVADLFVRFVESLAQRIKSGFTL